MAEAAVAEKRPVEVINDLLRTMRCALHCFLRSHYPDMIWDGAMPLFPFFANSGYYNILDQALTVTPERLSKGLPGNSNEVKRS